MAKEHLLNDVKQLEFQLGGPQLYRVKAVETVVADTGKTLCNGSVKPAKMISFYRLRARCKEANVEEIM
jgi:hypothetical protein